MSSSVQSVSWEIQIKIATKFCAIFSWTQQCTNGNASSKSSWLATFQPARRVWSSAMCAKRFPTTTSQHWALILPPKLWHLMTPWYDFNSGIFQVFYNYKKWKLKENGAVFPYHFSVILIALLEGRLSEIGCPFLSGIICKWCLARPLCACCGP